tara:strand:- start:95 stop:520 length:426 start_codon:yes stop_codon:yes gene_type:complete
VDKKALSAISISAFAMIGLVFVLWKIHADNHEFWITLLITGGGAASGWLVGFLASPVHNEREKFEIYAKLIASGVSVYLIARLEPTLGKIFNDGALLTNELYGTRFIAYFISLIVSAISMYVFRMYLLNKIRSKTELPRQP